MNIRSLLILTLILGVIATALIINEQINQQKQASWNLPEDTSLISEEALRNTAQIQITGRDNISIERRDAGLWVIGSYHNLPLDISKMGQLITDLREASLARLVTKNPEKRDDLQIDDQSLIAFYDESGDELGRIYIGKTGKNGGRIIARNDETEVYLTDNNLSIDTANNDWVETDLIPFTANDVKAITLHWPTEEAGVITVSRETQADEFAMADLPEGATLYPSNILSSMRNLTNARFTDVFDASEATKYEDAFAHAYHFALTLFDETSWDIYVGQAPEPEIADGAEINFGEERPVYMMAKSSGEDILNPFMDSLAFEVSEYTFNSQPDTIADWLTLPQPEEEEAAEETDTPAVLEISPN